jgi:hypothetical protein
VVTPRGSKGSSTAYFKIKVSLFPSQVLCR